jgi:phosphate transport system protein
MTKHLQSELEQLRQDFLHVYDLVAADLRQAVQAAAAADGVLARQVEGREPEINEREVGVEADCLKLIALNQPVADDLRFIIGVLMINRDLERIGDLADAIARKADALAQQTQRQSGLDLNGLADQALDMLQRAIDAFIRSDQTLAKSVVADRAEMHVKQREINRALRTQIINRAADAGYLLDVLSVSKYLERSADHAANIAEEVLYMLAGEIVRHRGGQAVPVEAAQS